MPALSQEQLEPAPGASVTPVRSGARGRSGPHAAVSVVEQPTPAATAESPAAPVPVFAHFLLAPQLARATGRRRRVVCGLSIAAHAAGLLLAATVVRSQPVEPPMLAAPVTLGLTLPSLTPPPASAPAPGPAAPPKAAPKPRAVAPKIVAPAPAPAAQPAPEPAAALEVEGASPSEGASGAVADTGGTTVTAGVAGGTGPVGAGPPAPSPDVIARLLQRYLEDVLRTRIAARLQYPPEAERLGIEGTVLVRATVDGSGRLVAAVIVGACPHETLCEAGLATVRASNPLPPPPRELGARIDVTIPLVYKLE